MKLNRFWLINAVCLAFQIVLLCTSHHRHIRGGLWVLVSLALILNFFLDRTLTQKDKLWAASANCAFYIVSLLIFGLPWFRSRIVLAVFFLVLSLLTLRRKPPAPELEYYK